MNTIKFSHHYPKLWGQKKATLIDVKEIRVEEMKQTQIEYDTYYNENWKLLWLKTLPTDGEEGFYHLPNKGKMLLLVFLGEFNIPFTTIRPYNKAKHAYYIAKINQEFEIKVVGDDGR